MSDLQFYASLPADADSGFWTFPLLGSTIRELLTAAVEQAGGTMIDDPTVPPIDARRLLLFAPAPALSPASLRHLAESEELSILCAGRTLLAACGSVDDLIDLDPDNPPNDVELFEAAHGEGIVVRDAESAYAAQEALHRRVNMALLSSGVFLTDPNGTHVSPLAEIAPGVTVLPNCQIYGRTRIAEGCTVGPNAMLRDAVLEEGVTFNASQITGSTVGAHTTVGPFAYIRPGCRVGSHVRIGDFVELKNSTIGDGTKVSHLTYIGDSDFGSGINVGCGVVTVNYDGKNKWRTTVDDRAFIGCNVNLVAPVHVGEDAFLAAGGTVTRDVPAGSLHVARSHAFVKEGWVEQRRKSGKL